MEQNNKWRTNKKSRRFNKVMKKSDRTDHEQFDQRLNDLLSMVGPDDSMVVLGKVNEYGVVAGTGDEPAEELVLEHLAKYFMSLSGGGDRENENLWADFCHPYILGMLWTIKSFKHLNNYFTEKGLDKNLLIEFFENVGNANRALTTFLSGQMREMVELSQNSSEEPEKVVNRLKELLVDFDEIKNEKVYVFNEMNGHEIDRQTGEIRKVD